MTSLTLAFHRQQQDELAKQNETEWTERARTLPNLNVYPIINTWMTNKHKELVALGVKKASIYYPVGNGQSDTTMWAKPIMLSFQPEMHRDTSMDYGVQMHTHKHNVYTRTAENRQIALRFSYHYYIYGAHSIYIPFDISAVVDWQVRDLLYTMWSYVDQYALTWAAVPNPPESFWDNLKQVPDPFTIGQKFTYRP